jgi:hypothetical protein
MSVPPRPIALGLLGRIDSANIGILRESQIFSDVFSAISANFRFVPMPAFKKPLRFALERQGFGEEENRGVVSHKDETCNKSSHGKRRTLVELSQSFNRRSVKFAS